MQRAAAQLDFDTNKLRTLIAEYVGIEAELVTDEAHFSDDLGLDWLDQLELMALIENEFAGVEISETKIEVVGDLIRHIESTNKAQSAVRNTGLAFRRSAA
jgi:acyl carrier protein